MAMKLINRSAIMVMPAQPFLDWLHRVDPTSAHLTLADLRQEPAIYLLPECESKEKALPRACGVASAESLRNNSMVGIVSPPFGRSSATYRRSTTGLNVASTR